MDVKQAMDAWVACWGPELVRFREASLAFNHFVNSQKHNLTPEQRQDATNDKKFMKTSIAQLVKDRKEVEKTVQHASQEVAKAKKNMRETEAKVSVMSKWLRMEVEQNFLEPYGVTRAAYHGGHLVRPSVKAFMENADDIFSSLEVFVMDVAEEKTF